MYWERCTHTARNLKKHNLWRSWIHYQHLMIYMPFDLFYSTYENQTLQIFLHNYTNCQHLGVLYVLHIMHKLIKAINGCNPTPWETKQTSYNKYYPSFLKWFESEYTDAKLQKIKHCPLWQLSYSYFQNSELWLIFPCKSHQIVTSNFLQKPSNLN